MSRVCRMAPSTAGHRRHPADSSQKLLRPMAQTSLSTSGRPKGRGFSLIELLVSMGIGLIVTLAISSVLLHSEGTKRTTTSVNDINQAGAYSAYVLDRVIRSAGSGYGQRWRDAFGCTVFATKGGTGGTQILPRPASKPWPVFPALPTAPTGNITLAPVLIGKNEANSGTDVRGDLITVMAGTAGYAEVPQAIVATAPAQINVNDTLGYQAGDLVLLADAGVPGGCMLQQLGTPTGGGGLPLAGDYLNTGTSPVALSSFGVNSYLAQLGSADPVRNDTPDFKTFGVIDNNVLASYDLLNLSGTDLPSEISDGIVELRALYGIDTLYSPTGKVQSWIDPVVGSGYEIAALRGPNMQAQLRNIIAIRVGMILRTSLREKDPIAQPGSVVLFADFPAALQQTRTLSSDERHYRFKTVDFAISLRNVVLAP